MSLTASEQRALARIERALRFREPLLESLFATFTILTWREAMPAREQVQPSGWWPRMITFVPLAFALIAAIIAVGSLGAASRPCTPGHAAASAASRWDHGCPARMISWNKAP